MDIIKKPRGQGGHLLILMFIASVYMYLYTVYMHLYTICR